MLKSFLRYTTVIALALVIIIGSVPFVSHGADSLLIMRLNAVTAYLNNENIPVDPTNDTVSPFTYLSKTMVPVRFVENLGAAVKYTFPTEPVIVTQGDVRLTLTYGKATMEKIVADGEPVSVSLPQAPVLAQGKTCVPIREIAEALGFSVNYNPENFVIAVSSYPLSTADLNDAYAFGEKNLTSFVEGVQDITAKQSDRSLKVGETLQLSASYITFSPSRVGCSLLFYQSSDSSVAEVSSQGKVTALAAGTVTITVSSHNGKTAAFTVHITGGNSESSETSETSRDSTVLPLSGKVICIDAGHGKFTKTQQEPIAPGSSTTKPGNVTGTTGKYQTEEQLNLKVALKLQKLLEERGATVVMTRTTHESSMTNIQRAEFANNAAADLTIRIHANGSTNTSVYGMEMWIPTAKYLSSQLVTDCQKAGEVILAAVVQETGARNRGLVRTPDLTGFNWSKVPVILIEMGYMTNASDDEMLARNDYQDKIALGLAKGTVQYLVESKSN